MSLLAQVLVFLVAAVVAVPISKRLGLGSVLGYLAAGLVIGPSGFGIIEDVENLLHFSELGVVLLLFLIGLELQPRRVWELRRAVFVVGAAQVLVTGALLAGIALLVGLSMPAAIVAGLGLALSSTAFALQLLAEKNQLATKHGRTAFGILLFQDLAVIPLLAALPLLGDASLDGPVTPGWLIALKVVAVLAGVVLASRYVVGPLFRFVAKTQSQEVFTAATLLIVLGTALAVSAAGLSMALGAFLAGVLLAESEYRHELEADLEPFKGVLLGLFFIAVGMNVRLGLIVERPLLVVALVLGLTAVKALVLFAIGRKMFRDNAAALSLAISISQGGEFAFVLFNLAARSGVMDAALADLLIVVVTLSMGVTPLLSLVFERWVRPRVAPRHGREFDVSAPEEGTPVLIAGFGRVGQVVGRVLQAKRIPFTAMDIDPEHIDFIRRFGNKVFYGDASRLDLLRAARADKARVFVLAIDDVEASMRTAKTVRAHFPHLVIYARARNRLHAYQLLDLGLDVKHVVRETFASSIELTGGVLEDLGLPYSEARRTMERFREHDERQLVESLEYAQDVDKLLELAARARQELEDIFARDAEDRRSA